MDIASIIFDFGNVLGFFSHGKSAEQLAVYTDMPLEALQAFLYGGQLEEDYEAGRLTTPNFIHLVREKCRLRCTDAQFAAAYSDMFTPNQRVCALVPALKRNLRLILLSNTNDLHYQWFSRQFAEVLSQFDGQVLSHVIGVRKPRRRIYEAAIRLAGRPASECLFIDDMPANVEGARVCGLRGLVYRREVDLAKELIKHAVRWPA
ncbi:MAG: HAD family hydrolase [Candidatus Acidiferrum sp.]